MNKPALANGPEDMERRSAISIPETIFNDVDDWWEECVSHGNHTVLASDDPQRRLLGYACDECNEIYYVGLVAVKALPLGHPLRDELRTATSRQKAPWKWHPGCVLILEEGDE